MTAAVETGDLPVTMGEVKAWLRMAASHDDATLAGLIRTAAATCEAYTGLALLRRTVTEPLPARTGWQLLSQHLVMAIDDVVLLAADGSMVNLPVEDYTIDIDVNGNGWVRVDDCGGAARIRVTYQAGMGDTPNALPEALRQGIIRLVEYLYQARETATGKPPAIVMALWQPWRRMRLGR
ncbi:MAG: hypothetical protein RLZZ58_1654 [Pseudomonadota bacterium]|jgi:uncharacterized phiE125 gp8 family phage protein